MAKSLFNRIKQALKRHWLKYRAKNRLQNLRSDANPQISVLAQVLLDVLNSNYSIQETKLMKEIELQRSLLLQSEQEIEIIDYGAGTPDANRSTIEMQQGVSGVEKISNIAKASKPQFWAEFLFKLLRILQPVSCLELGSCVGISAAYQASALKLNQGGGQLITLEGSPEIAKLAEQTLHHLQLENTSVIVGPFHKTLAMVLKQAQPIDYFFNDGHHDHDAVIRYYQESLPYLADGAIVIFDDISWSDGMRKAWKEIENDSNIAISFDFGVMGLVFMGKTGSKIKIRIPF